MKNIDFDAAGAKVAKIRGVACVDLISDLCLEEGREKMAAGIRAENLDRVVVAACSPEFKEHVLGQVLENAGLDGHLLCMANIREQCSWAHEGDVTEKAVELMNMAVNKARLLQPVEKQDIAVDREVLVVGGGFSAVASALQFSRVGLRSTLLEKEVVLGTATRELEGLHGFDICSMIDAVEGDTNIEILTSGRMTTAKGTIGDFTVTITKEGEEISRKYGAIVLATGYRTELALGSGLELRADEEAISRAKIVSQEQLFGMLNDPFIDTKPKTIGFVFGFSDENSRFPTLATLNNALAAKKEWDSEIYVFCKDVEVDSEGVEKLYREARECGVVFLKCEVLPRIAVDNGRIAIEAEDVFLGEDTIVACDLLVAEELLFPTEGTAALSSLLNILLDSRGFYQDENVHLYPVASEKKGVFLVGGCRGDLDTGRVLTDISSAVMSIDKLLLSGTITVEIERVKADPQKCVACLTCIRVCPHGAIQLGRVDGGKEIAVIADLACDACGICAAVCPAKAIDFQGYRDDQLLAQIEAIGES